MPSSYTTSLRLTLPATGELSGQWGNTVNTGITELLDAAVAGTTTISTWGGAGVAYTLSNNSGTADEARRMFIVATGTPGEAKNVICPAVSKLYVFRNNTTGGFALTLKTSGGTGIAVAAGQAKLLYCDGTNVVEAVNALGPLANLTASQAVFTDASKNLVSNAITGTGNVVMSASPTLTGTVGAASLTLSSLTSGRVTYAGASGLLQDSANFTFNGTDLTVSGAVNAGSVNATTLDLTNLEVTNIKAKDGTASASIADSTGVMSLVANPVLSGGTANGVLFLNGSKVATSGTALAFSGTSLTVGAGSGNPFARVNGGTSAGQGGGYSIDRNGTEIGGVYSGSWYTSGSAAVNTVAVGTTTAEALLFGINYSEQMRLTSTGLGIGTSSPSSNFVVSNGGAAGFEVNPIGSASAPAIYSYNRGTSSYDILTSISSETRWQVGSTPSEQMRLTSTGLGIGTSSPAYKLDVSGVVGVSGGSVRISGTANPYTALNDGTNTSYVQVASGALNLNVGGANPITFTTNSTLKATLDSSGNLGIGTSSPATLLDLRTSNGVSAILRLGSSSSVGNTTVGTIEFYDADADDAGIKSSISNVITGNVGPGGSQGGNLLFSTATSGATPTERMRLDSSGNLGIGTSSPTSKLDVNGVISAGGQPAVQSKAYGYSGTYYAVQIGAPGSNTTSVALAVDVSTVAGSGFQGQSQVVLPNNGALFVNAAGTDFIGAIRRDSSNRILIGPNTSGGLTLGDVIVDSSGNLGLGVTPSAWSGVTAMQLANSSAIAGNNQYLDITTNGYYNAGNKYIGTGLAAKYAQAAGAHQWYTAPSGTAGNAISFTQAMTLTSGGNLLVGSTTDTDSRIRAEGTEARIRSRNSTSGTEVYMGAMNPNEARLWASTNTDLTFGTNNTERARITSGGYFKASNNGTYLNSAASYHELRSNADANTAVISSTNTGSNVVGAYVELPGAVSTLARHFVGNLAGVGVQFEVSADGDVTNTNGTYGTISDQRLKQDIVDASSQWADIKAIRFRKYRLKQQVARDANAPYLLGVVAQEIEQTSPGLVEDGEVKSVKSSVLLMKAAVALQEAMTRIEQLEARVAALEAKP